mgnify:CR=1 FL=1
MILEMIPNETCSFVVVFPSQMCKDIVLMIAKKKPRQHSFSFSIRIGNDNVGVCKKYFREMYQVSDGRIYNCCAGEDPHSAMHARGHLYSK